MSSSEQLYANRFGSLGRRAVLFFVNDNYYTFHHIHIIYIHNLNNFYLHFLFVFCIFLNFHCFLSIDLNES